MIHQFKNNGYNIVMDVPSGAIHVVDDLAYEIISMYQGCDRDEIVMKLSEEYDPLEVRESLDEVEDLIATEQLFTEDDYEDAVSDFKQRDTVVKALCLHIAHDCNLACRYCFAGEGEYHGRREFMSFETGRKALDFLMDASGSRRNLEVDFFGGEPLMNWQTIKDLVAYGRSKEEERGKRFRFTVTTNGMLLNDDVTDFCNAEMGNVVLSLDGRRAVHDYMRPTRGGKGSYDVVVPKFQRFAERREGQYYLRGTFTRHNLDFAKDVEHYLDLGFDELSMEPVVAPDEEDYAIRQEDLPRVMEEYDRLAELYVQRAREGSPFTFFHFMIDLKQGPCAAKRLSGCGSGCEYLSVTPDGRLWPCHQFAGEDEFLLGNVDEGITNRELTEKFSRRSVYTNEKCRGCFARFYCSGGCAANAFHYDGSLWGAYDTGCEMERKRVECAIAIQAELAEDE